MSKYVCPKCEMYALDEDWDIMTRAKNNNLYSPIVPLEEAKEKSLKNVTYWYHCPHCGELISSTNIKEFISSNIEKVA